MNKYVTDAALTAQAVETPCTPLAAAFPTLDLAFVFAVHVTEMAKLGPGQYPLLYSRSRRIALVARQESLACTCIGAIRCQDFPAKGVAQVVH